MIGLIANSIILLFIFVILYKKKKLQVPVKYKIIRKIIAIFFEWCRIEYKGVFTSVLLPLSLVVGYWYLLFCGVVVTITESYTIYEKINSIIVAPIVEEVLFRGILFAIIILCIYSIFFKKLNWRIGYFSRAAIGLLVTSLAFSFAHGTLDARFISGLIFGFVYLLDKRNLLPAVIAHAVDNIFMIYLTTCPFGI